MMRPAARPDAAEPAPPCPAQDPQEHGLGLVVARVAGRDPRRAEIVGGTLEERVADAARLGFEVSRGDGRRFGQARDAHRAGEILDEGAVARAFPRRGRRDRGERRPP
jgi:hypothetical protein